MGEREMLELAARAAGLKPFTAWGKSFVMGDGSAPKPEWNPLEDDGDALRLGAKIEMEMELNKGHCFCRALHGSPGGVTEFDKDDTLRAIRRAITRAAAEIGKAMPAPGAVEGDTK